MSAATVVRYRNRVRYRDLAWVGWRQHRTMLASTSLLALAVAALMVLLAIAVATRGSTQIPVLMFDSVHPPAELLTACVLGYSGLVAVFWAAPLLSREYEHRTHLFAWSQDVSAARWLAGKTLLLVAAAVALALILGIAGQILISQLEATTSSASQPTGTSQPVGFFNPFQGPYFAAAVLPQIGYSLFGFALGLCLSALCRRTILSMGLSLALFLSTRMLVAGLWRPYYQTPERITTPLGQQGIARFPNGMPENTLTADAGLLNTAGNPVDYPTACRTIPSGSGPDAFDNCLRQHGIASHYYDYQPADRLGTFHLIEFGIFTALALALLLVTWRIVRRTTRL